MSAKRALIDTAKGPNVLVVDDDRRVRELLEIALTAHGFGVLTASDGDEAIRRALGQRPDLIVLDVRLPKKSGLEVCDALRGDTEDPSVPIILVSAAVETDARLQAFARGADDYLAKPFSPKELIARIKRHLARHAEARASRRQAQDLERQLARAQEDARRAESVSRREQALRELASGAGRDFLTTLDLDELAARVLGTLQQRLNVGVAALLAVDRRGERLEGRAIRGAGIERIASLELRADGEIARMLTGLERPMLRADLERIPDLTSELQPFMAAGFTLFVPLRGSSGRLEALVVTGERHDGQNPTRADLDVLTGLCESAAVAVENSLRFRSQIDGLLDVVAERASEPPARRVALNEAARLVTAAARAGHVPPRWCDLMGRAVTLGGMAATPEGRETLERLAGLDPTGRIADVLRLAEAAPDPARSLPAGLAEHARVRSLLALAASYAAKRAAGGSAEQSLAAAIKRSGAPLDAVSDRALRATLAEILAPAPTD